MVALVVVLLLALVLFAVASGMQSYASAQQAQATIEVARVAQINAWGNVITILTVVLLVVVFVVLVTAVLWFLLQKQKERAAVTSRSFPRQRTAGTVPDAPQLDINTLIQLKALEMLTSMNPKPSSTPALPASSDVQESSTSEPFHWLR